MLEAIEHYVVGNECVFNEGNDYEIDSHKSIYSFWVLERSAMDSISQRGERDSKFCMLTGKCWQNADSTITGPNQNLPPSLILIMSGLLVQGGEYA